MKAFGINTSTIIINVRLLGIPLGATLVVAVLIFFALSTSISRIPKLFDELRNENTSKSLLEEKLDTLQKLEIELLERSDSSLIALPSNNSVLWFISQLKASAEKNQIEISNIGIKMAGGADLNSVSFTLGVNTTDRKNILLYLQELQKIAPVNTVEEVSFSIEESSYKSNLLVYTFWSKLPEKIPAVDTPVKDLSQKEKDLLQFASDLNKPVFTTLDPESDTERRDPFY